jgi:site-specific DNA-methyltransferase (adenine-specific)/site-specific DNA-methyltransferase (cytosine-N4-specific)
VKPYYDEGGVTIYLGDCREVLPTIDRTIHSIVTSPPYAMQREQQYGGIPESDYPQFTVDWMNSATSLVGDGSVLVNIREHISDGEMSDYVHQTRLAVRSAGWIECDEMLWVKPDAPPLGHPFRPRRSWERILWFSRSRRAKCYPTANGKQSDRLGFPANERGRNTVDWTSESLEGFHSGQSRQTDYAFLSVGRNVSGIVHPAMFPPQLAAWMISTVTGDFETVLDPFVGSGTTLVVARQMQRQAIGIEIDEKFCEVAANRLAQGAFDFGKGEGDAR